MSIDLKPCPSASHSIVIQTSDELDVILEKLQDTRILAVYCVAGSWNGGSIRGQNLIESSRLMWKCNVETSLLAGQIADKTGAELLILTAAKAVVHGTPEMIGYGLAKKAVTHLTKSLAEDANFRGKSLCILPYS